MTIFKKKISNPLVEKLVSMITDKIRPSDALIRVDEKIEGLKQVVCIKNSTNGCFVRIETNIKDAECTVLLCEDNPKTAANITTPFNTRLTLGFHFVHGAYSYADQCTKFLLEGAIKDRVLNTRIPAISDRKHELDEDTVYYGIIKDFSISYKGDFCSSILKLEDCTVILLDGEKTNKISIIKKGGVYVENKKGDFLIMSLAKFEKRFITEETVAV